MCRSFIFFISFVLLILLTSCERTLMTADLKNPETCVTKLSMCELDAENHNFVGMKGEKGEIGFPGSIGPIGSRGQPGGTGSKGEKGVKGSPGKGGIQGPEGGIGPVGRAGNNGTDGRDGLKGDPGKPGSDGQPGLQGEMGPTGPQGEKGERGHKGDTGAPGIPGTCDCYNSKESTDDITDTTEKPPEPKIDENWGTELQPAKVTCKDAPSLPADRKFFFMNPGPMKVTCDKTKTCIQYSEMKNISYTEDSEPFWLSSKNVTLQDIYNLNIEQIYWLHNQSFSAYTTIRYHCLNSKPVNENSTLAMELLTWNDLVVGSKDTFLTPLHYTTLYDGCSDASKTAWNYTDITLVSTIAKRLPIIDFLIKDVKKNEIQKFRVEILNLCFG